MQLFLFLLVFVPYSAFSMISMELTRGVASAIPISIVPFAGSQDAPQDVSSVIANDLQNSGRFKVYGRNNLNQFPSSAREVSLEYFRRLGTNHVVVGKVQNVGADRYQVSVELLDIFQSNSSMNDGNAGHANLSRKYTVSGAELRKLAHHISDLIYQQITGTRGIFSTKLAYVVVQRVPGGPTRYLLEVADQDGYGPRPLLVSFDPIMSPAWSPNGRQIAYVSFENSHAAIYIEDVATGARRLISEFPGINGAPAWSPDGRKLALVLSKSGAPNIYIMDIATKQLRQLTNDFYINTEPVFSPNGHSILFTSNRSGGPQIYQLNLASGATSRVSYDGDYNARASYTPDGRYVVMIHRVGGVYNIATLELNTSVVHVISQSANDSDSPSVAPNGSMVLFDTFYGGRSVLAMVSADGRVQLRLPARSGEAQDPAWSPFLS